MASLGSETRPIPRGGAIDVWALRPERADSPDLHLAYSRLLTDEERARGQRFLFEKHQKQHLLARALVRATLSRYLPVEPADWRFAAERNGRPRIVGPVDATGINFNLSHTDGLLAVAVAAEPEVGIDVERSDRLEIGVDLARRYFSLSEVAGLAILSPDEQRRRFFDLWTLKESYIKARGLGLALPLDQFSFDWTNEGQPRISFEPGLVDRPDRWQFWQSPKYFPVLLAVGLADAAGPIKVTIRETIPLLD